MFRQDLAREIFPTCVCASVQEASEGHVLMKQGVNNQDERPRGRHGEPGILRDDGILRMTGSLRMTEALVAVRTAAPDNSTGQEAPRSGPEWEWGSHTQTKRLDLT